MLEDLLNLLGEKESTVEKPPQKLPERYMLLLRFKTQVKDKKGKPYYVFILKGLEKRSLRAYSTDKNYILSKVAFRDLGVVSAKVKIFNRLDDGRASCWLKDKLAGLI